MTAHKNRQNQNWPGLRKFSEWEPSWLSFCKSLKFWPILILTMVLTNCTDHERNIEAEQNAGAGSSSSSSVGADNHQPSSSSVSQNGSSSSSADGSSSSTEGSSSSGDSNGEASSSSETTETTSSSSGTGANDNSSSSAGTDNSSSSVATPSSSSQQQSSSSQQQSSSSITPSSSSTRSTLSIAFCGGSTYEPSEKGCCDAVLFNLSNQRCGTSNVIETKCGTNGWYDAANTSLRCENSVIETKCGTNGWYDAANTSLRCENGVVETSCGDEWYYAIPTETYLCYEGTLLMQCGTVVGSWHNPKVQYCQYGTTPATYGSLEYGGQTYKTVVIGSQVWMAENLNYGTSGKCYGDDPANCDKYGSLYNWATAMNIANTYNSSLYRPTNSVKYKGICPAGWHIPNGDEWATLAKFAGGTGDYGEAGPAVTKLKAKNGWNYNGNGTDDYGFAALPGGLSDGNFDYAGDFGYWWSSSEYSTYHAYRRLMSYNGEHASWDFISKAYLQSVRCVKDTD